MIWHGLATYDLNGVERPGLVVDNKLYDLAQLALAGQPEQTIGMPDVDRLLDAWDAWVPRLSSLAEQAPGLAAQGRLTAIEGAAYALPYRPRRIFGVASNFYEHADEMGTQLAPRAESQPYVFMKAQSSVIATKATVLMPAETEKLDWEVELGVVIGQTCRHVSVEDALSVIAGYTVFNDISARDLNRRTDYPFKHDWFRGKSFDIRAAGAMAGAGGLHRRSAESAHDAERQRRTDAGWQHLANDFLDRGTNRLPVPHPDAATR